MKNELKKLRFQKTFDELKIKNVKPDEINSYYLHEMPKQNKLIDGAEEILAYLKSKGYLLFIVTNGFKEVQFKKLETAKLTNYFDKVFISEEIKAPKPDPKIFEYAIKSANAPKQKSLMIGDDFEIDVKGALNYGIDAVFLTSDKLVDHQNIDFVEQRKQKCYFIDELKNLKEII
jgi:putative hydrolase of the HAD superfamily